MLGAARFRPERGQGGTGTAIGLPGFLDKASDEFIRETIKHGRANTRMMAFQGPAGLANLSDQEIDDVIVCICDVLQRKGWKTLTNSYYYGNRLLKYPVPRTPALRPAFKREPDVVIWASEGLSMTLAPDA